MLSDVKILLHVVRLTMSDLISRQDAIEAVYQALRTPVPDYKNDFFHDSMSLAVNIVKNIPSAEPERKWIPVSERLPKVRTDVLMMFEKNMAVGFYSHGCWNVNTGNGLYTGVFTDEDKPIAWMPLPEPYREEMKK